MDGQEVSSPVVKVSARHLYSFLEVGNDSSHWIKEHVAAIGVVEGQDFVVVEGLRFPNLDISKPRAQASKESFLAIDVAKKHSTVVGNDRGKKALSYLIECEQRMVKAKGNDLERRWWSLRNSGLQTKRAGPCATPAHKRKEPALAPFPPTNEKSRPLRGRLQSRLSQLGRGSLG